MKKISKFFWGRSRTPILQKACPFINFFALILVLSISVHLNCMSAEIQLQAIFTPPKGWQLADAKSLPPHVKIMVVGKGAREMPPSMNLGYEKFSGTLKDYLKIVKDINISQGDIWKSLGDISTEAGPASLSQVDMKTEWGILRQMHLIFAKDGIVYILTAAALKEEFSLFYKEFFDAMKSFRLETF